MVPDEKSTQLVSFESAMCGWNPAAAGRARCKKSAQLTSPRRSCTCRHQHGIMMVAGNLHTLYDLTWDYFLLMHNHTTVAPSYVCERQYKIDSRQGFAQAKECVGAADMLHFSCTCQLDAQFTKAS